MKWLRRLNRNFRILLSYQKLSCKTMEQVRRLLADISATGSGNNVQLSGGQMAQKETLERLQETIQEQGDQQQELLEEISRNIRELSKGSSERQIRFIQIKGETDAQKEKIRRQWI